MPVPAPLILAIGDSLIAGYGLAATESFPAQLEQRLRTSRPDARVIAAGVCGDTTEDVMRRLPRVLSRLDHVPDLAVVQVGPNDVLRQIPPSRTRAALTAIVTELRRCGLPVLLTTVDLPVFLRHRATAYLTLHAEVAAAPGATTVPFFPAGVLGHPDMVIADRVHPNARAIVAVIDVMLPAIERLLSGARVS